MTFALRNNISKYIVLVVLFQTFRWLIFPVILQTIINFASFWTDPAVSFILYRPQVFPSFQLGQCLWSAGLVPCSWETTADLGPLDCAGCQHGRESHLKTRLFTSAKLRLSTQERTHVIRWYTNIYLLFVPIPDTELLNPCNFLADGHERDIFGYSVWLKFQVLTQELLDTPSLSGMRRAFL